MLHRRAQWVKVIDGDAVRHLNWTDSYEALREASNSSFPGYLWHEAVVWDDVGERWLFLPRRASFGEPYNELDDQMRGSDLMLWAPGAAPVSHMLGRRGDRGGRITVGHVGGVLDARRGFSALKMLPGGEVIVALRTEEVGGRVSSTIIVLHVNGTVLMPDVLVSNTSKFEGLEIATAATARTGRSAAGSSRLRLWPARREPR